MSEGTPPNSTKRAAFLSPAEFSIERVFPIRNLVATEQIESWSLEKGQDISGSRQSAKDSDFAYHSEDQSPGDGVLVRTAMESDQPSPYLPPPWPELPPLHSLRRIPKSELDNNNNGPGRMTERSRLVPTISGPPGILPGSTSKDAPSRFHACEDEPIHIPGAIQQFGALVALRYNGSGDLEVRVASENSLTLLGQTPQQLFELKLFLDIFDLESRKELAGRISLAIEQTAVATDDHLATRLEIVQVATDASRGFQKQLWCAMHISFGTKDLIICEFEEYSPHLYLGDIYHKSTLPRFPISILGTTVGLEERHKSHTRKSRPLRVLDIARRHVESEVPSMDVFSTMTDVQGQLANCQSVQEMLDVVVGIVAELTGFHRVMFYRFDAQNNGSVDAEYVDPNASEDLFRGLHYPASDIPEQARQLYKLNRVRLLLDRDAETARLVCREDTDFKTPLDLSHAVLRAMSPIHLKYLGNMGVRSSLSISVVINENLWGLIACHGYGETGIRVTLPVRELCRNIGECAAMNIQRLLLWERIQRRKVPKVSSSHQNPASFIAASSADLLQAFGADCGLLSISDESRTIGKLDPYREVLAILAHLQQIRFTSIYSSQNINADFPNINYPPGINTIAGILVIPLSLNGTDFLIFFRKGQLQEICWAGNPYEKVVKPGSEYLEPRMSFKHWTEKVVGMSTEWTEDQVETASVISLLYGRFIEIWRQKESAGQRNKLTRLLIKNSSHEVRTPLNAIVNYLEIALENHIDDNTREILSKAHEASRSLIYVIDDLLNLTKAEDTPFSTPGEAFDLGATVSEVITTFRKEAMRKGLDLTVSTHEGIPETVKGDSSRLRQVLSNITSNAFQHSISGTIKFDTRLVRTKDNVTIIGITIQDAGIGMSESQLDDLFQEFEQVSTEDNRLIVDDTTPSTVDNDIGGTLGVGLAVVARYVRNMKGLIRVQSEPGKGTIFGIELPFEIVTTSPGTRVLQTSTGEESISRAELRISCESITEPQTVGLYSSAGSPIMLPSSIQDESLKDTVLIDNPLLTDDPATGESLKSAHPFSTMDIAGADSVRSPLSVLVAEDNPINWRLVQKRLQKWGHLVVLKADGQECHDHYKQISRSVDVVLMDIQMPLVDGIQCTRMIRRHEKSNEDLRAMRQRVPIIAVSASLIEKNRFDYIDDGFDGWILKPIDFARLDFLLRGINTPELKHQGLYLPGHWERGGWFLM